MRKVYAVKTRPRSYCGHARQRGPVAFFVVAAVPVRIHSATACGSNRTHVPRRNDGMCPRRACLKMVIRDTDNNGASSSAVNAWSRFWILSARDVAMRTPKQGCLGLRGWLTRQAIRGTGILRLQAPRVSGQFNHYTKPEPALEADSGVLKQKSRLPSRGSACSVTVSGSALCSRCRSDRARVARCEGQRPPTGTSSQK
jgi:hypothetical protein